MKPVWVILAVFLYTLVFSSKSGTSSLYRMKANDTIVALLPVHTATTSKQCSNELNFKAAVESRALKFAVEKLNSDPNFKNAIPLGFDIEDICNEEPEDLLNVLNTLFKRHKNEKPAAFLGDLSDLLTKIVLHKSQNIPVFTLGSRSGASKDDDSVFRFEPNKPRIGNAVAKLAQELNWTVFDIFVANTSGYESFTGAEKSSKVCQNRVFYEKYIEGQTQHIDDEMYPLLVFSDSMKSLTNLPSKFKGRNIVIASEFLKIDQSFPKTLAVKQRVANLDEFEAVLLKSAESNNSWFGTLIRDSAQFQDCGVPGNGSCLSEILGKLSEQVRHGEKIIDAVYTIAHALKNSRTRPLRNDDVVATPEFTSPTGKEICFTPNKDLSKIEYSVYDLAKKPFVVLGNVKTSPSKAVAELSLDGLELSRDTTSCLATCPDGLSPVPGSENSKCCVKCQSDNSTAYETLNSTQPRNSTAYETYGTNASSVKVRVDYLKWKHPLSIIIFIFVILLFCVLVFLVNLYSRKAQAPAILTSKLATLPLLLSLFITLIHPLLPIIKPSSTSCNAYVFGFVQALGIPVCILISRSNSYFKRYREEDGSLKKKVCRTDPQNLIAIFLIIFQITLSIIFIAVSSAHVVYYETADPYVDYIECSTFSGGEYLFPFFYTMILAIFFTVKNFGAVTQERDSYESHFTAIFFFGYYFLSFVSICVVYGVVGKVKVMLLCVLGVLHLLNFLCFIFLPKVYVVVFKRDLVKFSPPLYSDREILILDLGEQTIEEKKGAP